MKPNLTDPPKPNKKVTWSESTKPPAPKVSTTESGTFELGMELLYKQKEGKSVAVVNKGATSDGLSHTVRCKDGSKIVVHYSNLQLLKQPDFTNIPKNPLDYRNLTTNERSEERRWWLNSPTSF